MPVASLVKHWKRFTQGRNLQSRPGTVVFIVDLSVTLMTTIYGTVYGFQFRYRTL